jgi:predicted methyltransferase
MSAVVLSHFQTKQLLEARDKSQEAHLTSPDLGLSQIEASLESGGVRFPDGTWLSWGQVEEIQEAKNSCFLIEGSTMHKIQSFSEISNQLFSLYPTMGAPTMLISGIPMHRIKDTEPHQDTLEKIKAIRPINGRVLDTATGLGYTAIEAARSARSVVTIEISQAALEVARFNPWSRALFDDAHIEQIIGDSYEIIPTMPDGIFNCIIHDPPAITLYGDLYSGEFYRQLYRVLRFRGKLFHYIGNPESKSGGSVTNGVVRRLGEAGFTRVQRVPKAFGVVAFK